MEENSPRPAEKLIVRNFLSIRSAEMDIKRFNVIIGTQAQGKSVLAKLTYYFRQIFTEQFTNSIGLQQKKHDFDRDVLERFLEFFPRHSWGDDLFEISYHFGMVVIEISKNSENDLDIRYSEELSELRNSAIDIYSEIEGIGMVRDMLSYSDVINKHVYQSEFWYLFKRTVFIPDGRVFFSNLQQIFQFLRSNTNMSPILREFGEVYQSAKSTFVYSKINPLFREQVETIIKGQYRMILDEDWIVENGRRTKLSNASSGQKEALPMLLVLAADFIRHSVRTTYFVEEPEAHLFPDAQKQVIELMAASYFYLESTFFLTTHSPYVLTAINNLVYASNVYKMGNEVKKQKVIDVVPEHYLIRAEDLSAYMLEDGKLREIIDEEDGSIESDMIDGVSDEFEAVYDQLLKIEFDHEL